MRILAIESSCDETAASIVEDGIKIISNVVASSANMHAKTGGVIPEQAARQQLKSIVPVIAESLGDDKDGKNIDAIAVTAGPGLIGSLLVGVEAAKTLSYLWSKPIIPVNHLVGHLYANWFDKIPDFPALGLVISGGHTDLVLMRNHGKIEYIGGTRDDAAGEAFDKSARLLGLEYPGGPNLSKKAEEFLEKNNKPLKLFPRPLSDEDNFEWSFSGLKTAVSREIQKRKPESKDVPELAAEIQEAIVDSVVSKCVKAILKFKPKSFLLGGGVAANSRLREKFKSELTSKGIKVGFHVPEARLCTDNATYIASCAFFNQTPRPISQIEANPELTINDKV